MCGIAGVAGQNPREAVLTVERMCTQMFARGPDDGGIATILDGDLSVVLGARRLAIIDPSPAGHQPMRDSERGTTLVYNGMIYNFRELRSQLEEEGERFSSTCDTEVVLRAYGRYGANCVQHLHGMFAFAVCDERDRTLFLARDRLGIKPLYYAFRGGRLLFASQVKALLRSGEVSQKLSPAGLSTYLSYGAVSEPLTAIEGVLTLPAGHHAHLRNGSLELERYWEPPHEESSTTSRSGALEELRELLDNSVRRHLVSDAPLGVFLSGGLDSSLVAAIASHHTENVRTVSVVFDDPGFSETRYMESVAEHIGSRHVVLRLGPNDLMAQLDDAFVAMDQPTFDGVNTYVVSRAAAATGLKVALSGLGADELFDGYGYVGRARALERARRLPKPVARLAAFPVGHVLRGERGDKASSWLRGESQSSYSLLRRLFLESDVLRLMGDFGRRRMPMPAGISSGAGLYHQVSELDLTNYLKNVLLRDTDAMSMSRSLEVRVPYLDHTLVEWALRQPEPVKGRGKTLLTASAAGLVPSEVLTRAKQGFALPLRLWMCGELRGEVDSKLRGLPEALAALIDSSATREIWVRLSRNRPQVAEALGSLRRCALGRKPGHRRTMKVLHVIPGLAARTGGPAATVVESSRALAAEGIETTIFATDISCAAFSRNRGRVRPADLPKGANELDVRLFPLRPPARLVFSPALDRALLRETSGFDIVHIHSLFLFPQFSAYRRAVGAGRPYIVSPRGALDPYLRARGRLRKAATDWLWQRRMLERAAALHLTSEEEARLVADVAPAVRRVVVPNGITWAWYQTLPDPGAFRRGYLNGHDGPLVLNLGRVSHKKGLDILIRAFALVAREEPEARLAIVGPDDEGLSGPLAALAAYEGVEASISFIGMLTGDDKLSALAAADVWALPSHTENFGIAVVEALAAGLPVVVSPAVNTAAEMVAASAGLVCPPKPEPLAAELLALLRNPQERSRLGERAREFTRRFDWSVVAPELAEMYADVLAGRL